MSNEPLNEKAFQAMQDSLKRLERGASGFNDELRDSLDLARAIADSMERQHGGIQRAKKAMNGIVNIGQTIIEEERELDALSERRLQQLNKEARIKLKNFQIEAQKLLGKNSIEEKLQANAEHISRLEEQQSLRQTKNGQQLLKRLKDEQEIISGYQLQEASYKKIVDLTRERFKLEKEVTKTFGLTGVALSAASTVASKMGMGHISNQLDDIDNKLRNEIREAIELNDGKALGFGQRFMFAARGAALTGKAIGKGMLDPLYLIGKIYSAFLDVNKESVELSRLSGQNGDAMAGANFALATSVDFLKTAGELTKQMGLNAQNVFSASVMAGASELKNTMGLSAEEAGGLAVMAQTGGKDVKNMSTSMVSVVSSFNKSNRSAVSQGVALREAANASDSLKLSLGNNPETLAKAAAAATRLGLSLQDVDNIASSLMDFETSISNELEAELLIGKELNLEKARELALNNDLAGLSDEIFKNSADIAEFGKMNRIQQEAYAKSLGLTKDQLAKIAYNKALENNMTEEQAALAAGVEASDMRRMAVQEKMALVMDKIFQAFAPLLDVIELILDPLAKMLAVVGGIVGWVVKFLDKTKLLLPLILIMTAAFAGKAIASFFGTAVKGSMELFQNMKKLTAGGLLDKIKGLGSGMKDAFTSARSGGASVVKDKAGSIAGKLSDKVAGGAEQVGDKIAGANDKLKNVKAGTGVKDFLTNLGKGLASLGKSLANGQVILGLGVLTLAIIGIGFALKLAAPGIEAFGKVVTAVFGGIATLITAVADGFVKIMEAVTMDNIGPMLLLGPALFGIAAGLGALAFAGIAAIPAIGGLVLLSKAAPGLVSLGIGGENKSAGEAKGKSEEGGMAALTEQFKTLIELVKQGTTINLDGTKIATSVNRNLSKVQTVSS